MKKIISALLCIMTLFGSAGLVRAEEDPLFKNLKSAQVKEVMRNTVMIRPGELEAYVYGKKYSLSEYGEAELKDGRVIISAEFLSELFPDKRIGEGECDLLEFAEENEMTVTERNDTYYLSESGYTLPNSLNNSINKLFGIYVKLGSKGTGLKNSPIGSLESAKKMVTSIKDSIGLPDGGLTVYLREGNYTFTKTMTFDKADSGAEGSPIVWKAYKDERVSFDGGVSIKGSEFSEVTDSKIKERLPYPDKVVGVDLSDRVVGFGDSFRSSDPALWFVYYNDTMCSVARWPNNTEWARTGEILEDSKTRGVGFKFVVGDSRVKNWVGESDPRIFGYFGYDWAGERRGIASVDEQTLAIKTDNFAEYGVAQNKRYYVYNMVSELDNPGEFYYDKNTDYLYFYPIEGDPKNEEFLKNEVQFSLLSDTMIEMNASYVSFEKITFENSLAMGLNIAESAANVSVLGCTFKNIYKGMDLYGYNNTVRSCDFYNISNRPLGMFGGDRVTLTPSGSSAVNNKFWNFNTASRTNTAAIAAKGCGDYIAHNEVTGAPHTTVIMGGNDNVVEYNEFYNNLVDGAHDAGVFYGGRNLSELGNVYRCNYFHDNATNSIGVIYFDDGMSGNTVDTNVFENTGTGVFVHGGVASNITNNLFIGGTGSGAGFSSVDASWKMETATSLAANTLLYQLKQFPYSTDPWWSKYQYVFKYLESDEKPITMYDNNVSGNILIDKNLISATDKDQAAMIIEDNVSLTAEEAENYELPEIYTDVMENAGIYIDEYREKTSELGSFNLLRPYNKQTEVEASEVYFEWEKADDAYGYQITIATDRDFKNIITNKIVTDNFISISKLNYFNTRYYWKVKAIANDTNSMVGDKTRISEQDYYTFTTKKTEIISKDVLYERIALCEGQTVGLVEGDGPGEYKEGTLAQMQELIDKYTLYAAKDSLTQKEVNTYAEELKSQFEILTYNRQPEKLDLASMLSGPSWNFTPNQTVFGKDKISITYISSNNMGTAQKLSPHIYYKFKIKWDGYDDGWFGIGLLAQSSNSAVPWSGNPMYFTIFKKDTVEFQKWGSGTNQNFSYPNLYTKNDEWATYEVHIELQDDGSNLVTWKMDGVTVVEYVDNDYPITTPGYLYIYNGTQNATLELMPADD